MSATELALLRAKYGDVATDVLRKTSDFVNDRLRAKVADLTEEGEHVRISKAELGAEFDALGITPNNSFTLEGLFRTQTALAYGSGRWQLEQDPAVQEILWGYKYVTVGDDRVRPEHVGFEGVTLPKDDAFWKTSWPPNGFACVPPGTMIVTEKGLVPIENIRVGERVLTHEGRLRPVLQLHRNPGPKEVVAVDCDRGATLRLTGNHRVFTNRGWVEASRLQIGDEVLQMSRLSFTEKPRRQIEDRFQAQHLTDRGVTILACAGASLKFQADAQLRQVEIEPVAIGVDAESEGHAGRFEDGRQLGFRGAHLGFGVRMAHRVGTEFPNLRFGELPTHFRTASRGCHLQLGGSGRCPFGIQGVGDHEGILDGPLRDAVVGEDSEHSTEADARVAGNDFERRSAFGVVGKHPPESAWPRLVESPFCAETVSFRSLWLLSDHATIVDVIWASVKEIRTIPYTESEVLNLTVAEDQSYFADGIAVHNCRCVAIPLYEPAKPFAPPEEIEVDGKMVTPSVDKGFEFNPGTALGVM